MHPNQKVDHQPLPLSPSLTPKEPHILPRIPIVPVRTPSVHDLRSPLKIRIMRMIVHRRTIQGVHPRRKPPGGSSGVREGGEDEGEEQERAQGEWEVHFGGWSELCVSICYGVGLVVASILLLSGAGGGGL